MRRWTSRQVLAYYAVGLVIGFVMAAALWAPPPGSGEERRMSPWYWIPIVLAVLGVAWEVRVFWVYEDLSLLSLLLLGLALGWAMWLWISHEPPDSVSAPTRTCTVKQLVTRYDAASKRDVPSWVCIGWGGKSEG